MKPYTELAQHPEGSTEWLQQRNEGIGSSDCSVIFGLSSYDSPYSLWLQKTGQTPLNPPVDERTQELFMMGHALEPVIRTLTAERVGKGISKPPAAFASVKRPWQRYNADGMTEDGVLFEAKNVSWFKRAEWDGQISDHAEMQVHHGAAVTGATHAIVAALIGGNELKVSTIEINQKIVEIINEQEAEFWGWVESRTEPPLDAHLKTLEAVTQHWKHADGVIEVETVEAEPWLRQYAEAKKAEAEAVRLQNEAKAHLAAMMDGHDRLVDGKRVLASARRTRISEKRLREAEPELFAEFCVERQVFDSKAFKAAHPDKYAAYQGISVIPGKYDIL